MPLSKPVAFSIVAALAATSLAAQQPRAPEPPPSREWTARRLEVLEKQSEDLMWYFQLGDIANIDMARITTSQPVRMANPTGQGAGARTDFHHRLGVLDHGQVDDPVNDRGIDQEGLPLCHLESDALKMRYRFHSRKLQRHRSKLFARHDIFNE